MVKNINKILENSNPIKLCRGLEAYVALLRNKEKATSIDVKLYFADFAKLQFKMRTINAEKLNPEVVKKIIKDIDDLNKSQFPQEFEPILNWAHEFAKYAEHHTESFVIESRVNELEAEISGLTAEINVQDELMGTFNDPALANFYNDTQMKDSMISEIDDALKQQANNAGEAQTKYNAFHNKFIRFLNDERQLASRKADE